MSSLSYDESLYYISRFCDRRAYGEVSQTPAPRGHIVLICDFVEFEVCRNERIVGLAHSVDANSPLLTAGFLSLSLCFSYHKDTQNR